MDSDVEFSVRLTIGLPSSRRSLYLLGSGPHMPVRLMYNSGVSFAIRVN
jgi:hypothetical protein